MKKLFLITGILIYCLGIAAQDSSQEKGSEKDRRLPTVKFSYENYIFHSGYLSEHFSLGEEADEFFENFTPVVVPEYFFLGTLGILPKRKNPLEGDKAAQYRPEEKPLVEYLEKYLQQTLNISLTVKEETNNSNITRINIYSPELMEIKRIFFDNETGALKEDLFHSDEQIASYILGVYYRFGRKLDDNNYRLPILSIYIGMERMFSLLVRLEVRKVIYLNAPSKDKKDVAEESNYFIDPTPSDTYKFLFEPSQYLEKYLDTIKEEKEKLTQSIINDMNLKLKSYEKSQ